MIHGIEQTYIDQEGVVWDWAYAICPRCHKKATPKDHHPTPWTSFICPHCDLMYDEPLWDDAECAFVTCVSDDEAEHDPELRPYWLWYHEKGPWPQDKPATCSFPGCESDADVGGLCVPCAKATIL